MTKLTVVPPSTGEEDKNAEPKVGTAFKAIETWANGEIDGTTNIKAEGVLEANLSKAVQEKLGGTIFGLTYQQKNESFEAVNGKFYEQIKAASTTTLPAPTANRVIGILCGTTSASGIKVTTSSGSILGSVQGATNLLTLTEYQAIVVEGNGTDWLLIAGEVRSTKTPGAQVSRLSGSLFEANPKRATQVYLQIELKEANTSVTIEVGTTVITQMATATAVIVIPFSFYLNAGQEWKWKVTAGTAAVFSSYQTV